MVRGLTCLVFSVVVLWASTQPAGAQYGYYFGRNKIQYEDWDWHILKTEHFDIYYYPEMTELAEYGAHFAEEVYKELQNRFRTSINRRIPLIFYSSNIHFKQTNITPGFIPDGVGGFFEFLKGRVVVPANGNIHTFRRVIRHELVHVFTYATVTRVLRDHRVAPDRFIPLWFTEGLAEYWSGKPDHQAEMVLRDAVFSNYLVPLENLDRIAGTYLMYKEGEATCRFISEIYGEEKLLELIENAWKDRDFRVVMSSVLREDFETIADRWLTWFKEQYYPSLDTIEFPTYLAGTVSAEGFNAKPVYYRFRDGTRKIYFVGNRTGYSNIYEVEVDSLHRPIGKPRILIRGERNNRFEAFHLFESRLGVSRDGKLAFVTKSGMRDVVHVYDLERDEMGPTYAFSGLVAVYSPDWDPSGTKLAFSSIDKSGFSDLYVFDTENGHLQKLTDDKYDDRDPAWSPDGRMIAFSSDRTSEGKNDAYNLMTYDLASGEIQYRTFGFHHDLSPRWSPDGSKLVFIRTQRDEEGRFGAQNVWMVDVLPEATLEKEVAYTGSAEAILASDRVQPVARQLTDLSSAAFDPVFTEEDNLVFTSFENYRFIIRSLPEIDSLAASPKHLQTVDLDKTGEHWAFGRIGIDEGAKRFQYRRKYNLDVAQGQVSQNPVWGTTGGAVLVFSDMLGDDYWYLSVYNGARGRQTFLKSMNLSLTRVQLHQRTHIAYGAYRYGGLRYDITDPDAASEYPLFWETMYGGFGAISYPISMFRRIEFSTSLSWSDKEVSIRGIDRQALLLSNGISLVHDNTLYGMNGPVEGWRASLSTAYTTDIRYSNVNYFTLAADARHYWRLAEDVTLASWVMGRINQGREARLFILGGSWDLRGYRLFSIRGRKMWFTSHELRFPLMTAPSVLIPILAPFGLASLRGAAFIDAAHVWNEGYHDRQTLPLANGYATTGQTIGSAGLGLRINLFGGFVLRYDVGYRYTEGFKKRSDRLFRQFFFGWDF